MLLEVKGVYHDGKVDLLAPAPTGGEWEVTVTFERKREQAVADNPPYIVNGKRVLGLFKGKIKVGDDFDNPIDDMFDVYKNVNWGEVPKLDVGQK